MLMELFISRLQLQCLINNHERSLDFRRAGCIVAPNGDDLC